MQTQNAQKTLTAYLKGGIHLRRQRPGLPADGPLTPMLQALQAVTPNGRPVSPMAQEITRLVEPLSFWTLFVHTNGAGAVPVRDLVILDAALKNPDNAKDPYSLSLTAHELVHVLQRRQADSHFWPTGYPRFSRGRRWLFDSTNYMEVQAYLAGWTVEHDFLRHKLNTTSLSEEETQQAQARLEKLVNRITTLSSPDVQNAIRLILTLYPNHKIYMQNFRTEAAIPDRRVPPGDWQTGLEKLGMARPAIEYAANLANKGGLVWIDPEKFNAA